jgi:hypothetical protein
MHQWQQIIIVIDVYSMFFYQCIREEVSDVAGQRAARRCGEVWRQQHDTMRRDAVESGVFEFGTVESGWGSPTASWWARSGVWWGEPGGGRWSPA